MAGHSKWANIKRKKEIKDGKKSKVFSKVTREILMAIQQGGPDQATNARLRIATQNARSVSLPKDNILRLIKKAKNKTTTNYTKVSYEGYGPYGIGFVVEAMTDNINRTVAHVRSTFSKGRGNLDKKGAISHLFDYRGVFIVAKQNLPNWEETALTFIEAGMDNIVEEGEDLFVTCLPDRFSDLQRTLEAQTPLEEAGFKYLAITTTKLTTAQAKRVHKLVDDLEDLDDVQFVYHTMENAQSI